VKKSDVISLIFNDRLSRMTAREKGLAFAPTNIALCKYWGKRDMDINIPMTSSLSIALPDKGALTAVSLHSEARDKVILNDKELESESAFVKRVSEFLDLFRPEKKWYLVLDIKMNIPVAAGLASSACGFASLTLALNDLFDWNLAKKDLSILARLGSGSASRSLWNGFVEWHAGVQSDGMDSYAVPLDFEWPELRVGILSISNQEKLLSSRRAMQQTVDSSSLYASWPKKVARDLVMLRQALQHKNVSLLGGAAESNALSMHATMLSSWPPVCYFLPETIAAMQQIWDARRQGLEVYFTEDAGPNLKLLFQDKDEEKVKALFPQVEVVRVFDL
jgi:diphosphomevalonate decarboxylase